MLAQTHMHTNTHNLANKIEVRTIGRILRNICANVENNGDNLIILNAFTRKFGFENALQWQRKRAGAGAEHKSSLFG